MSKKGFVLDKNWMRLLFAFLLLIVWTTLSFAINLWETRWWLGITVNFLLIVYMADMGAKIVSPKHKRHYEISVAILFPLVVLIFWEWIVGQEILNPLWFPPPSRIGAALWDLIINYDEFSKTSLLGRPWLMGQSFAENGWAGVNERIDESHLLATLFRVFSGFLLGTFPGIIIGVVMGLNKTVRLMLDATMSAVYVLPKIAIFPIMMLVFADPFGEGPKIAVVAISTFFLVAISTMAGVRDVNPVLIMAGKNFGANPIQQFWHIIFPAALPVIFAGMRIALGTSLIVVVAIEFLRAKKGVGYITYYNWTILSTDKMYAGLVVVMLLGVFLTFGLQWIERKAMPWNK